MLEAVEKRAKDRSKTAPFTVVIDGREKAPYSFTGLFTDGGAKKRPLIVPWEWKHLKTGDYAIAGLETECVVERKSLADLYGTLGRRRKQFEAEFERMSAMPYAAVVIEADWNMILHSPPAYSKLAPKTVFRTVLAWQQRYPNVHWNLMGNRRLAEIATFRTLERFWMNRRLQLLNQA